MGAPKVLVNNIKSLHLMNPTNPTVVADLIRRYPDPKKQGSEENNLESEDSEEDEPLLSCEILCWSTRKSCVCEFVTASYSII